jgi:hypothetical protein
MANPTGTVYLTAAPGYVWADGDVYAIAQSDQQEGAAIGASFGGLGVDNYPHQVLLDKLQLVHNNQLVDEGNIATLAVFKGLFTGLIGPNGYVKIGVQDVSRGLQDYLIQWGSYLPSGGVSGDHAPYTVTWNLPFPNACYWAMANLYYSLDGVTAISPDIGVGLINYNPISGNFYVNKFNANGTVAGFTWLAIGF